MLGPHRARLLRTTAFVVFLAFELVTGWKNLQDINAGENGTREPVAEWERRMQPLKESLPIKEGVVGYVSDASDTCFVCLNTDAQIEFVLTQYALAPIIIDKGLNHDWIVGTFGKAAFEAWTQAHPGEFEVTRFPYGVYLIHRLHT